MHSRLKFHLYLRLYIFVKNNFRQIFYTQSSLSSYHPYIYSQGLTAMLVLYIRKIKQNTVKNYLKFINRRVRKICL